MVLPTMTNIKPMYLSRDALAALWPLEEKLQRGADSGILAGTIADSFPTQCLSQIIRILD